MAKARRTYSCWPRDEWPICFVSDCVISTDGVIVGSQRTPIPTDGSGGALNLRRRRWLYIQNKGDQVSEGFTVYIGDSRVSPQTGFPLRTK